MGSTQPQTPKQPLQESSAQQVASQRTGLTTREMTRAECEVQRRLVRASILATAA
jgi:hypothetical protein